MSQLVNGSRQEKSFTGLPLLAKLKGFFGDCFS